jgi:acyl-CoA thioesterase
MIYIMVNVEYFDPRGHPMEKQLDNVRTIIQENDALISLFGMEIVDFGTGKASVQMTVTPKCLNAAEVGHGGTIFSLADVAFALASNSHGKLALAIDMSISYLRAVPSGERIIATCNEKHRGKRTGSYLIEIVDSKGQLVSLLKATAFRTDDSFGQHEIAE